MLAHPQQGQRDRQRQEEVDRPEGDQRADRAGGRQQRLDAGLQHSDPARHVRGDRRRVGDHVDRGDAQVARVREGRHELVEARRHEGEVGRADRGLRDGELHRGQLHRPLADADRPRHEGRRDHIGDRRGQRRRRRQLELGRRQPDHALGVVREGEQRHPAERGEPEAYRHAAEHHQPRHVRRIEPPARIVAVAHRAAAQAGDADIVADAEADE